MIEFAVIEVVVAGEVFLLMIMYIIYLHIHKNRLNRLRSRLKTDAQERIARINKGIELILGERRQIASNRQRLRAEQNVAHRNELKRMLLTSQKTMNRQVTRVVEDTRDLEMHVNTLGQIDGEKKEKLQEVREGLDKALSFQNENEDIVVKAQKNAEQLQSIVDFANQAARCGSSQCLQDLIVETFKKYQLYCEVSTRQQAIKINDLSVDNRTILVKKQWFEIKLESLEVEQLFGGASQFMVSSIASIANHLYASYQVRWGLEASEVNLKSKIHELKQESRFLGTNIAKNEELTRIIARDMKEFVEDHKAGMNNDMQSSLERLFGEIEALLVSTNQEQSKFQNLVHEVFDDA